MLSREAGMPGVARADGASQWARPYTGYAIAWRIDQRATQTQSPRNPRLPRRDGSHLRRGQFVTAGIT